MARRTMAQILGVEAPTDPAPVVPWGWVECCCCGAVFLAPRGRTQCWTCRDPTLRVVRVGRGRDEDDEEGDEMARPPVADPDEVRAMAAQGLSPLEACRGLDLTAQQMVGFCYRHSITFPGLPSNYRSPATRALQAKIDAYEADVAEAPPEEPESPAPDRAIDPAAAMPQDRAPAPAVVAQMPQVGIGTQQGSGDAPGASQGPSGAKVDDSADSDPNNPRHDAGMLAMATLHLRREIGDLEGRLAELRAVLAGLETAREVLGRRGA